MSRKISVGFTGDFSFSGYFYGCQTRENLIEDRILEYLNGSDAQVINFESPITPCRMTKKKRLAHRSDPSALGFVKEKFGNPILSLANNHMMDYNRTGLVDTIENVKKENVPFIGAGLNVEEAARYEIVGDDLKVGIFAVQYKKFRIAGKRYGGPMHFSKEEYIRQTIRDLKEKEKVDYVVMVYHGGDEFLHAPMPYFRKQLRGFLGMGCDLVVAHHPHVVQGYEYFGKKMIFYSLGNFMFDTDYQRMQDDSDRGVVLTLHFSDEGVEFDHLPVKILRDECRVVAADEDRYFAEITPSSYKRLWAVEAARKEEILRRAAELKEREEARAAQEQEARELEYHQLRKKYGLLDEEFVADEELEQDSILDESKEENDRANDESMGGVESSVVMQSGATEKRSSGGPVRALRRFRKKVFSRKRYESLVIKRGALKAKLFYSK